MALHTHRASSTLPCRTFRDTNPLRTYLVVRPRCSSYRQAFRWTNHMSDRLQAAQLANSTLGDGPGEPRVAANVTLRNPPGEDGTPARGPITNIQALSGVFVRAIFQHPRYLGEQTAPPPATSDIFPFCLCCVTQGPLLLKRKKRKERKKKKGTGFTGNQTRDP